MKVIRKKKIEKQSEAAAAVAKKYGIDVKRISLKKEHRTLWLFEINGQPEEAAKEWKEVVADYIAKNPDVPYTEAMKNASQIFKAQKAA